MTLSILLGIIPNGMSNRSEPKNPFRYGALAFDEAFTDRERELRELKSDIRNGQDVVVFAPGATASPRSCSGRSRT